MARWSRSRLRTFGVGAVALLGGSLLVIPAVSQAGEKPSAARPAAATPVVAPAPDRITTVAGKNGRSAFQFKAGSGDPNAPFSFVSTGGTVRAQQMGGKAHAAVQAKTGGPKRTAARVAASASAETYATTFTVDSQNWTAQHKFMSLWNRDSWTTVPLTNPPDSLSATASLAPGNYYITAMYGIYDVDSYMLTKAFTVTNTAQTVHLDEKSAKEVGITVDDSTAQRDTSAIWMALPNGDLIGFAGGGPRTKTYVTTASVAGTTLRVHEVLTKAGSSAINPSPYRYDLMKSWPHPLPAAPMEAVKTASLAKTTTTVLAQGITTDAQYETVPLSGESTGVYLPTSIRVPATITEYVSPDVLMSRFVFYGQKQVLDMKDRSLPAGTSAGTTMGAGPLVPGRRHYQDDSRRTANQLQILENSLLNDAAGNSGTDLLSSTTTTTLRSGGQVLVTANASSLVATVPPAQQTYQLEQTFSRKVGWSQLSTQIHSEWTFASAGPASAILPLMDLAMSASGLDQRNRAGSAPVRLTVTPSTRQSSAKSTVNKLEWSVDDGATWTDAPIAASGDGVAVTLALPATAAFVSLRVTASNDQGGTLRRTVLRALAGPAVPGDEKVGATTVGNVTANTGYPLVIGTTGGLLVDVSFTATDPSGIASGGLLLWHDGSAKQTRTAARPACTTTACAAHPVAGGYLAPDGLQVADTTCYPVNATTSNCSASVFIGDVRYSFGGNALAGPWQVEAWASAKDGSGFADRQRAGTMSIKRATTLTSAATPEIVAKGKTVTVTGALTLTDWDSGTDMPFAGQTVTLLWSKPNATTWTTVKTIKADANGKLKTTVTAGSDGYYMFSFAGDATSSAATSVQSYVDVQ